MFEIAAAVPSVLAMARRSGDVFTSSARSGFLGPRSTTSWSVAETSMTRDSFNAIVTRQKSDFPAVMMRMSTLMRDVMLATPTLGSPEADIPIGGGYGHRHTMAGPSDFPRSTRSRSSGACSSRSRLSGRQNGQRVRINDPHGDGQGSIRLGTPTTAQREQRRQSAEGSGMQRSASAPSMSRNPRPTRFGYMPPEAGLIVRQPLLPPEIQMKVDALFGKFDTDSSGEISRSEALAHFKKFAKISANAMFSEVDVDGDDWITLNEFREFWQQVRQSGYSDEEIHIELDELYKGNAWVNYDDFRDVDAGSNRSFSMAKAKRQRDEGSRRGSDRSL